MSRYFAGVRAIASVEYDSLRTAAGQASLSMGFSRQEYQSGLSRPLAGDLPNPGIKPASPVAPDLQVDSLLLSHQGSPEYVL